MISVWFGRIVLGSFSGASPYGWAFSVFSDCCYVWANCNCRFAHLMASVSLQGASESEWDSKFPQKSVET